MSLVFYSSRVAEMAKRINNLKRIKIRTWGLHNFLYPSKPPPPQKKTPLGMCLNVIWKSC